MVTEDKAVKNTTKEAVIMINLAMVTEDKEIPMEDSKAQAMVGTGPYDICNKGIDKGVSGDSSKSHGDEGKSKRNESRSVYNMDGGKKLSKSCVKEKSQSDHSMKQSDMDKEPLRFDAEFGSGMAL